jgi:hypothetical protein
LTYSAGVDVVRGQQIPLQDVERLTDLLWNVTNTDAAGSGDDVYQKVSLNGRKLRVYKRSGTNRKEVRLLGSSFSLDRILTLFSYTEGRVYPGDFTDYQQSEWLFTGYYSISNVENSMRDWRSVRRLLYTRPNAPLMRFMLRRDMMTHPPWSPFKYVLGENTLQTHVKGEVFIDHLEHDLDGITFPLRVFVDAGEVNVGTMQVHFTEVKLMGMQVSNVQPNPFNTPFSEFAIMLGILWTNRAVGFAERYEYRRRFVERFGLTSGVLNGVEYDVVLRSEGIGFNVSGHAMCIGAGLFTGFSKGLRRYLAYIGGNIIDDHEGARTVAYDYESEDPYGDTKVFAELGSAPEGTLWHSPVEYYAGFLYAAESIKELEPVLSSYVDLHLGEILRVLLEFDEFEPRRASESASLGHMRVALAYLN